VNTLEATPLTTTIVDPATGEQLTVVVDGGALVDWIRDQSRTNTQLTRAPAVLDELARGSPNALAAIAMYRVQLAPPPSPGGPAVSYGLGYGVGCREQFSPLADISEAGRQAFPLYLLRFGIRQSALLRTTTMTVQESGKCLPPQRRCFSPS
jgi:hypothetical protein